MRVGAIPNPKKTIVVKGTQEEVSKWLYKICPYLNEHIKSGYIQENLDENIGRLEIGKYEFLSLGACIVIDTNYKDDQSTEVNVEIQRKVGAFDQSYEITYANEHLSNTVKAIQFVSKNYDYNPIIETPDNLTTSETKKKSNPLVLILAVIGWLLLLGWLFS
jgi:hypothetical protein